MKAEQELKTRTDFHSLLTDISNNLLESTTDTTTLKDALEQFAEYFNIDIMSCWWFDEDHKIARRTALWRRDGIEIKPNSFPLTRAPWLGPQILAGQVIRLSDLDDVPAEAAGEIGYIQQHNETALAIVPLTTGRDMKLVGAGAATTQSGPREWTDKEIEELQRAFNVIATTEIRLRVEKDRQTHASFQSLVTDISQNLLKGFNDKAMLESELERLGTFFGVDGLEYWWFDKDNELVRRSLKWFQSSFNEGECVLNIDDAPWAIPLMSAGQVVRISDPTQLPAEAAAERALMEELTTTAMVMIPLTVDTETNLVGFGVALMDTGPREWTDQEVNNLILAFNIFATTEARMRAEEDRRARARFQAFLAKISSNLIEAHIDNLTQRVQESLGFIGREYKLDRVTLWLFEDQNTRLHRTHYWAADSASGKERILISYEAMPWGFEQVMAGKAIRMESIEDIPPDQTADLEFLRSTDISSYLAVPLLINNQIIGAGVFTTLNQCRTWSDETVLELRLLAEMLGGSQVRWKAVDQLSKSERDLSRSEQLASVGNYSFFPVATIEEMWPPRGATTFSAQLCKMLGSSPDEASFELFSSRVHEEDQEEFIESVRRGIEENANYLLRYRLVRPDGTQIYVEDRGEVHHNTDDKPVKLFGSIKDITDQVRRENELNDMLAMVQELKDQLQEENIYLRKEVQLANGFHKIVGESAKLKQALMAVEKVAPTDVTVLIMGETGTGKELIAQAIHDLSSRSDQPMVSVNCAALSTSLIESELFGHERGAFTGAQSQRKGRFELANKGTLFLDEIGELPLELQAKLLRVLQTKTFERLGGSETLKVDVRLITATNQNIKQAVDEGKFRADLYYRINSFPILMPSLLERKDDIPLLAEHLAHKHAEQLGKRVESISAHMIRYMRKQEWPGNVRELESFIERALISTTGPVLDYTEEEHASEPSPEIPGSETNYEFLNISERKHILKMLNETNWVISGKNGAAPRLGVPPSTLRSKMKRLGIRRSSRHDNKVTRHQFTPRSPRR